MKIYLAGSSNEWRENRERMNVLRAAGHTITFDWTVPVEAAGEGNPSNMPEGSRIAAAAGDLRAVEEADLFWLVIPTTPSMGALVEYGYALRFPHGSSGAIIVVSGLHRRSIFFALADRCFDDHAAALQDILDY